MTNSSILLDSSSSDEESIPGNDGTTTENVDELPNYLWKPSDSEKLADWESHTRVSLTGNLQLLAIFFTI